MGFSGFERWLMSSVQSPPIHDARSKAYRLTDSVRLNLAVADSVTENRIGEAVRLLELSAVDTLPQLLLEDRSVVGRISSAKDLFKEVGLV